jgi:HPt (histidine-containing phosphotransfer) domain-containing protein
VRLITATNMDLSAAVNNREFRADLFYRLNVVEIMIPPLRERGDDVLLLAEHLLEEAARSMNRDVVGFTSRCAAKLRAYAWPGNVRELANVIQRAVALAQWSRLDVQDLPPSLLEPGSLHGSSPGAGGPLASLAEVERLHIRRVMQATGGNKSRAAEILGVARRTLYRKGLDDQDQEAAVPPGVRALRDRFLERRSRDIDMIRAALESNELAEVARLAHNMKGHGSSYGFPEVSAIGEQMEAAALVNDTTSIDEQLAALEAWLAESRGQGEAHEGQGKGAAT